MRSLTKNEITHLSGANFNKTSQPLSTNQDYTCLLGFSVGALTSALVFRNNIFHSIIAGTLLGILTCMCSEALNNQGKN